MKYHKIFHAKEAKTEDEGGMNLPAKESEQKKEEKNDFKAHSQFAFMSHKSSSNHGSKEDC